MSRIQTKDVYVLIVIDVEKEEGEEEKKRGKMEDRKSKAAGSFLGLRLWSEDFEISVETEW